ncbi:hypothetical protein [Rudaea sp.]|uniref:hypothetical protein n=1 Tax=Rudaea sp. TaxID=2136325 RepID=UPI002ED6918F
MRGADIVDEFAVARTDVDNGRRRIDISLEEVLAQYFPDRVFLGQFLLGKALII